MDKRGWSLHVAELTINGALFHIREEKPRSSLYEPFKITVDATMNKTLNAGATILNTAKDYDHGYRQGDFKDPFGIIG